jgi:hypothetical protein
MERWELKAVKYETEMQRDCCVGTIFFYVGLANIDGLAKSRLTGENRRPVFL